MICPKCGHETSGYYCNNCGAPLAQERSALAGSDFSQEDSGQWESEYSERERERRAERPERETAPVRAPREQGTSKKKVKAAAADQKKEVEKEVKREVKRRLDQQEKEERRQRQNGRKSQDGLESQDGSGRRDSRRRQSGMGNRKSQGGLESQDGPERQNSRRRQDGGGRRAPGYDDETRARRNSRDWQEEREGQGTGEKAAGPSLGEVAAKGAVGMIVICSRVMQLLSCALMAVMVWTMTGSFLDNMDGLGNIQMIAEESNYGLGLYLGFAGFSLFMGVLWCFWILSRKAAGGAVRLKKYDTGRGFLPFLVCTAFIILSGPAMSVIPSDPQRWMGLAQGALAALAAVNFQREILLFCSGLGLALSLVRRILRV